MSKKVPSQQEKNSIDSYLFHTQRYPNAHISVFGYVYLSVKCFHHLLCTGLKKITYPLELTLSCSHKTSTHQKTQCLLYIIGKGYPLSLWYYIYFCSSQHEFLLFYI